MSVAVKESSQELKEYGVYNSETDINSNPKTGENAPNELVAFFSKITERLKIISNDLKEVQEIVKDNDKISSDAIDTCVAELDAYVKTLEDETNIKDAAGVD
jgi:hypothetical protein